MKTVDVGFAVDYTGTYAFKFLATSSLDRNRRYDGSGQWIGVRARQMKFELGDKFIESFEL